MKYSFMAIVFCSILTSCSNAPKNEKDVEVIKNLLQQERRAHFQKDADLFVSEFSNDMISVNKGVVSQLPIEEHRKRFAAYFNDVKFIKWDDVAEPIIKFSKDRSLAYAIVQKLVILERKDSASKIVRDTTTFAWTSIYRKQQNKWELECNISTNK